jgi:hypothetical protein
MTVEVLLLTPALFMFTLVIIFAMRLTDSQSRTQSAADVAARVASQSSSRTMLSRGYAAAHSDLSRTGLKCNALTVDMVRTTIRGMPAVTAEVKCNVDLSGLSALGLSRHVVIARSTEVVDLYRSQ